MAARIWTAVVVVIAAVALAPASVAHAATTAATGIPIRAATSDKCLNVSGGSTANSAKIVQYTCSGTALNDKFVLVPQTAGGYWIQSVGSGRCLNVSGASTAENALVIQYTCSSALNSVWGVQTYQTLPVVRFYAKHSGKCLTVPNASLDNNVQLVQSTCSDGTATKEQFYLPPAPSAARTGIPYSTYQPALAVQTAPQPGSSLASLVQVWIDGNNVMHTISWPDPRGAHPGSPAGLAVTNHDYGYAGRAAIGVLPDGRFRVIGHDNGSSDLIALDEQTTGTGDLGPSYDVGGMMANQPVIGPFATGLVALYGIVNGALWYAPDTAGFRQTQLGTWRSLGGPGLSGTPAVTATDDGARIFALNEAGQMLTATLSGTSLSDWTNLGGTLLSGTPSAVTTKDGLTQVFARGSGGLVNYKRQNADGTFPQEWSTLPGVVVKGSPAAVLEQTLGTVVVTVRDNDNQVFRTRGGLDGTYYAWVNLSVEGNPSTYALSDPTPFSYVDPFAGGIKGYGVTYTTADTTSTQPILRFTVIVASKGRTTDIDEPIRPPAGPVTEVTSTPPTGP